MKEVVKVDIRTGKLYIVDEEKTGTHLRTVFSNGTICESKIIYVNEEVAAEMPLHNYGEA